MPTPRKHMWDTAVDTIVEWVQDSAEEIYQQMLEAGHSPGAAQLSEDKKLAYYRRKMFNDDGSPNQSGRSEVMNRVGVEGYANIMRAFKEGGESPTIKDMYETPTGDVTTLAEQRG